MTKEEAFDWIEEQMRKELGAGPLHSVACDVHCGMSLLDAVRAAGGWKPACRIYGSEITFEKFVLQEELVSVCQNIWNHPSKYSNYQDGSEDAWYRFLKLLWVQCPEEGERRLADMVKV